MPDQQNPIDGSHAAANANALQKMIHEHTSGLVFAAEITKIAEEGTEDELVLGIEKVNKYNNEELEYHLQLEEQAILGPLIRSHPEHTELCIKIGKEHGYIRSLVEEMSLATARQDLADFGRILKNHTVLENEKLLPLIVALFTEDQLKAIENFVPLQPKPVANAQTPINTHSDTEARQKWLSDIETFFNGPSQSGGSIVLLPRFNPELIDKMAAHIGLDVFDFQQEVMRAFGPEANLISFEQLDTSLRNRATQSGIISHNVEALLCVKSQTERRAWLDKFLEAKWPNPVLLPITVFQADVQSGHPKVCDLELRKMPRKLASTKKTTNNREKYHIEQRPAE